MKTKTNQVADPETDQPGSNAEPAPLNSVLMAQGAERLEFIRGLIDEPEPATEVEEDPDSDTQTDETTPAQPAEPATETEVEPADEGEGKQETDDTEETPKDEDEIPGVKPEVQQAINRRIGKEVAKRRAAEARIEALETRLEQMSQTPPAQQPAQTTQLLDNVNNEAELETVLGQAREARTYARDASDRLADESEAVITELRNAGVRIPEDAELSLVRAELRKIRRNAESVLDREGAARKTIQQRAQYAQQVAKDFRWVKDRTSEEYATFRSAREHPAVRSRPDADFLAAIIVEGLSSYKARTTKPVPKPAAVRRPAPQPGRPAATRVEPNGSEAARQAMQVEPSNRDARLKVLERMLAE